MERLEVINKRLSDQYGRFEDGRPNWRVIWSTEQFEKRWVTHTKDGFELINPAVEEKPKYWYSPDRYILERLLPVPQFVESDLVDKTSYEPVWTFQDNNGNPLPPVWEAIFLLIKTVQANIASAGHNAPYKLPEEMGNTKEAIAARVELLQKELFGNETTIGDALTYDSGVGYGTRNRKDWN